MVQDIHFKKSLTKKKRWLPHNPTIHNQQSRRHIGIGSKLQQRTEHVGILRERGLGKRARSNMWEGEDNEVQ